jgi:FkbH-like protein
MEKIKLVIWDLDDTFWSGTLSEEIITPISENIEIVKELAKRGILSSIVSKNEFENAKNKLQELEIWDYFVFPKISWQPKGELVKEVINDFQFRPINVLFIDDNHMNLEEVKFYNPDINVSLPDLLKNLLELPQLKGKNDEDLSRLQDYKLLEEKSIYKKEFTSNTEFLRQSEVKLQLNYDLADYEIRIAEMIERTNQLNYTKKRISLDEVKELLRNPEFESFIVSASDKYGNYGIIGFVCLNKSSFELEHFLFSCRIMNLGIEDYIYNKIGKPSINIIGEVVSKLGTFDKIDWIEEMDFVNSQLSNESQIKLLFKGGCDLTGIFHYLNSYNIELINETNYVLTNNLPVHNEHSTILVNYSFYNYDIKKFVLENIPFFDNGTFETEVFKAENSIIVYSVLMDYTQNLYKHKKIDLVIPFGGYSQDLTDLNSRAKLVKQFKEKGMDKVDEGFLNWFSENFIFVGQITPKEFYENIVKLKSKINKSNKLILINGAEIEINNENEEGALNRHIEMNAMLDKLVSDFPEIGLVDLRTIVTHKKQLDNNIRHYKREVYEEISKKLISEIERLSKSKISLNFLIKLKIDFYLFRRRLKRKLFKWA